MGIIIGIFVFILLLGAFTTAANWYVRSDLISYAIPTFVFLAFFGGLIHKRHEKVGKIVAALAVALFFLHFLLAITPSVSLVVQLAVPPEFH
ncbi:hypothetical protein [Marinobacter sp.]|uniref:hypothetical protein n=1 Tax=Marinobacter sp. TaxID=50741 RepID=UPI0034A23B72